MGAALFKHVDFQPSILKHQVDLLSQSVSPQASLCTSALDVSSMTTVIQSWVATHTLQIRKLVWKGVKSLAHVTRLNSAIVSVNYWLQFWVTRLQSDLKDGGVSEGGEAALVHNRKYHKVMTLPRNTWALPQSLSRAPVLQGPRPQFFGQALNAQSALCLCSENSTNSFSFCIKADIRRPRVES